MWLSGLYGYGMTRSETTPGRPGQCAAAAPQSPERAARSERDNMPITISPGAGLAPFAATLRRRLRRTSRRRPMRDRGSADSSASRPGWSRLPPRQRTAARDLQCLDGMLLVIIPQSRLFVVAALTWESCAFTTRDGTESASFHPPIRPWKFAWTRGAHRDSRLHRGLLSARFSSSSRDPGGRSVHIKVTGYQWYWLLRIRGRGDLFLLLHDRYGHGQP